MFASIIYAIGGFIEALVGLRFILRLLGANPNSGFVQWIYDWSTPFVTPFAGIFGQNASVTGKGVVTASVFDWTALIALIVIGLVVALAGRALIPRRHTT
jgi:uncharacterized protein YggT (Ycf19 family)